MTNPNSSPPNDAQITLEQALRELNAAQPFDAATSWQQTLSRVRAQGTQAAGGTSHTAASSGWLQRVASWFTPPVAMALGVLVLLQSGALWSLWSQTHGAGAQYQTASGATGARLQLRLNPTASALALQEALQQHGLALVGGPSALGIYEAAPTRGGDVNAIASQLKQNPNVFVEVAVVR